MDYRTSSCKIFITLVSVIGSASIPVNFGREEIPQIITSLEMGRFLFVEVSNLLHCGIQTQLLSDAAYESESTPSLLLPGSLFPVPLTEHIVVPGYPETAQSLAIGPGSDLATTFGSVALVNTDTNSGSLLLNITEDDFVSNHCLPDSVIRIATLVNYHTMNIPHTFGRIPIIRNEVVPIRFTPIEYILKIHPITWVRIFHEFSISMNSHGTRATICNCTMSRDQLPHIQIELANDKMIILTPLDYTRLKQNQNDDCDLLIGPLSAVAETDVQMNPLLIPGFNSFATSGSTLILCEALHY